MSDNVAVASGVSLGTGLTLVAVQAGIPLGIGFAAVGVLGATVGHARWMLERERNNPDAADIPMRRHVCMLLRALLMAEFVCAVLLLLWIEYEWRWPIGLIVGAVSSVFASDAIELMWTTIKGQVAKRTGGRG